jgi:hypothetical protein
MCRFEVEDDQVGQVFPVLILATKDEQFVTLIQRGGMT